MSSIIQKKRFSIIIASKYPNLIMWDIEHIKAMENDIEKTMELLSKLDNLNSKGLKIELNSHLNDLIENRVYAYKVLIRDNSVIGIDKPVDINAYRNKNNKIIRIVLESNNDKCPMNLIDIINSISNEIDNAKKLIEYIKKANDIRFKDSLINNLEKYIEELEQQIKENCYELVEKCEIIGVEELT